MATKTATYKRYNGTDWDTIYFATSAAQVGVSSSRKFVTTSTKVNNVAFTLGDNDAATVTIYAGNIALSSSDATTVAAALSNLQPKDADLTAIAGLTGTSGFLKKTAANTWSLDTNTYTTTSDVTTAIGNAIGDLDVSNITGFGAGKTLSALSETDGKISATFQNISITKSQVSDFPASLKNPNSLTFGANTYDGSAAKTIYADGIYLKSGSTTTIDSEITSVRNLAAGRTKAYVIDTSVTTAGTINNQLASESTADNALITATGTTLVATDGVTGTPVNLSNLNVGDIIYTIGAKKKDYFVAGAWVQSTNKISLGVIEADIPDVSNFATKATTLAGYGITDAKIASGVITLGSDTITPLTSSSSLNAAKLTGTVPAGCYTNTTYESKAAAASGTDVSLVTTGEKATWNGKSTVSVTQGLTSGTKVATITINGTGTDLYCQTNSDTDKKTSSTASTGTKLYLLGATAQSANGSESKSNVNCYVGTDNCLYSNSNRVPTIFYADTAPTTGVVAGDICIEY